MAPVGIVKLRPWLAGHCQVEGAVAERANAQPVTELSRLPLPV